MTESLQSYTWIFFLFSTVDDSTGCTGHGQWRWEFFVQAAGPLSKELNCTFPTVLGELGSQSSGSWQRGGSTVWVRVTEGHQQV